MFRIFDFIWRKFRLVNRLEFESLQEDVEMLTDFVYRHCMTVENADLLKQQLLDKIEGA